MSDLQHQYPGDEPFYIIELGAGHGKFGFLLLRALLEESKVLRCRSKGIRFKLIMTDLVQANIDFWKRHPAFQTFIAENLVDFALLDAECAESIALQISGEMISPGTAKKPGIVVANYLLDSLTCDHFRINDGQLEEGLITVVLPPKKVSPALKEALEQPSAVVTEPAAPSSPPSSPSVALPLPPRPAETDFRTVTREQQQLIMHNVEPKDFLHWFDYSRLDMPTKKEDDDDTGPSSLPQSASSAEYYNDPHLAHVLHRYLQQEQAVARRKEQTFQRHLATKQSANARKANPVQSGTNPRSEERGKNEAIDTNGGEESAHPTPSLTDEAMSVCRGDVSLLFPLGTISLIRALRKVWTEGLLLMSADKGYVDKSGPAGLKEPHLAMHGCISTMVNYHAMNFYALLEGGFMLSPTLLDASIKVTGLCFPALAASDRCRDSVHIPLPTVRPEADPFTYAVEGAIGGGGIGGVNRKESSLASGVLGGWDMLAPATSSTFNVDEDKGTGFRTLFAELPRAFDEAINTFGPYDFFSLQVCVTEEIITPSAELALRMLRLSHFDADVFYRFSESFMSDEVMKDPLLRRDIAAAVHTTWKNYYALEKDSDVPFQIARFFFLAEEYTRALQFFDISIRDNGPSCSALFDKGLCMYYLQDYQGSFAAFRAAEALDPSIQSKSLEWIERIESKLSKAAQEAGKEAEASMGGTRIEGGGVRSEMKESNGNGKGVEHWQGV